MCSKEGPDMAATDSPGGPHVLPQTVWGVHISFHRTKKANIKDTLDM